MLTHAEDQAEAARELAAINAEIDDRRLIDFLNNLKALHFIDRSQLMDANAKAGTAPDQWLRFRSNPPRYLWTADDEEQRLIWNLIK
jgi:hypothetical protein